MTSILFLNHKIINCGVYQYGKRIYDILSKCKDKNYIYIEVDSFQEYYDNSINTNTNSTIFNYHSSTMPWLNNDNIIKTTKNIGILHEIDVSFFDITLNIDPDQLELKNNFSIPRPIFEFENIPGNDNNWNIPEITCIDKIDII